MKDAPDDELLRLKIYWGVEEQHFRSINTGSIIVDGCHAADVNCWCS
jgi:hypothetical protein